MLLALRSLYESQATPANATGAALSFTTALSAGIATGAAVAPGSALSASVVIASGAGAGQASADGSGLSFALAVSTGEAAGAASVPGGAFDGDTSVSAAGATGAAASSGTELLYASALEVGGAVGEAAASGAVAAVVFSLAAGDGVAGDLPANAPGCDLGLAVSLVSGGAAGISEFTIVTGGGRVRFDESPGEASGARLAYRLSVDGGEAIAASAASGIVLVSWQTVSGGAAIGAANANGLEIHAAAYDEAMTEAGVLSRSEREWLWALSEAA